MAHVVVFPDALTVNGPAISNVCKSEDDHAPYFLNIEIS